MGAKKRERQEARKQQRAAEREERIAQARRKKTFKSFIIWSVAILALGGIVWWVASQATTDRGVEFPYGSVHWHATLDIRVCGEPAGVEDLGSTSSHVGLSLLHTHGDNLVHVEGAPRYFSDITLGRFFNGLGIEFSDTGIYGYENGDLCPNGSPGTLSVSVNGEPIQNATQYPVKDENQIKIAFE